jgi:hypothetical protein
MSYNARDVKIYNGASSLVRYKNPFAVKNVLAYNNAGVVVQQIDVDSQQVDKNNVDCQNVDL